MTFGKFLGSTLFQIGLNAFVREIHRLGIFPILFKYFHEAFDELRIGESNAKFPALVEAFGITFERTQQGTVFVGQDQLRMEVGAVECVRVNAKVLQKSKTGKSVEPVEITD